MLTGSIWDFTIWITLIEFVGGLFIVGYVLAAVVSLIRHGNIIEARLLVANGAITGLSFKVAASLLKTIEIHTWQQILLFIIIFAIRTVLKRIFMWEQARLTRLQSSSVQQSH